MNIKPNKYDEREISRFERSDALGLAFLRTMILLNGGAILALLTFLGSSSAQTELMIELYHVKKALLSFIAAIISVLLGLVISYSYTASAPETCYSQFWNNHIVKANTFLGVVTIAFFVWGVLILIAGVSAR
jgi:hypothetical protein